MGIFRCYFDDDDLRDLYLMNLNDMQNGKHKEKRPKMGHSDEEYKIEKLLLMDKYFIERTDSRLASIEGKIDKLSEFRSQAMGISVVIGSLCGFLSAIACGILTYYITTHVGR